LEATAFLNPDGTIVVVLLNWSDKAIDFALKLDDNAVEVKSPAYSMSTFVIEATAIV
jgi:glucosylceramidase